MLEFGAANGRGCPATRRVRPDTRHGREPQEALGFPQGNCLDRCSALGDRELARPLQIAARPALLMPEPRAASAAGFFATYFDLHVPTLSYWVRSFRIGRFGARVSMKLAPWFLAALSPFAVLGFSGVATGQAAVLALALGIFYGTLSLDRLHRPETKPE